MPPSERCSTTFCLLLDKQHESATCLFSLLIINAKEKEITIGRRPRPRKKQRAGKRDDQKQKFAQKRRQRPCNASQIPEKKATFQPSQKEKEKPSQKQKQKTQEKPWRGEIQEKQEKKRAQEQEEEEKQTEEEFKEEKNEQTEVNYF